MREASGKKMLMRSIHPGCNCQPLRCSGWVFSLISALVMLSTGVVSGADVRLDVTAGIDNFYRSGTWNALRVSVSGAGADKPAQIVLQVRSQSGSRQYTRDVRLRSGKSPDTWWMNYFHPESGSLKDIVVQVRSEGRVLAQRNLEGALSVPQEEPIVVCLTTDQSGLNHIQSYPVSTGWRHFGLRNDGNNYGQQRPTKTRILYPAVTSLPDSLGSLDIADVVVLGDIALDSFSEAQWSALVGWVRGGGTLVISGGPDANRFRSRQLLEISPIKDPRSTTVSDLGSLGMRYGSPLKANSMPATLGNLVAGAQNIVTYQGSPLLAEHKLGSGLVISSGIDLMSREMRSWPGSLMMWREFASRDRNSWNTVRNAVAAVEPADQRNMFSGYQQPRNSSLRDTIASIQSSEAPGFWTIGLFLAAYIVVLVPLNYLILKALDRRELAWITMPIIVLTFSVGAFVIGFRMKGGSLYYRSATILEANANEDDWNAYTVAGIFSPRQSRYTLSVPAEDAFTGEVTEGSNGPSSGEDIQTVYGPRTSVKELPVNMWDHRTLDFQYRAHLGGPILMQETGREGRIVHVKVTNGTRRSLTGCSLTYRGAQALIGDMQPGGTKDVKLTYQANSLGATPVVITTRPVGATAINGKLRDALYNVIAVPTKNGETSVNPLLFTGWLTTNDFEPALEGETPKSDGVTLVVAHLATEEYAPTSAAKIFESLRSLAANDAVINATASATGMGSLNSSVADIAANMLSAGQTKKAIDLCKQAMVNDPRDPRLEEVLGDAYSKDSNNRETLQSYRRAVDKSAGSPRTELLVKFGRVLAKTGNRTEAIQHLTFASRDHSSTAGDEARAELAKLGAATPNGGGSFKGGGAPVWPINRAPITRLSAGQAVPPMPTVGVGSRRILQPVATGGYYLIEQQWNFSGSTTGSKQSSVYIAPGQPTPK